MLGWHCVHWYGGRRQNMAGWEWWCTPATAAAAGATTLLVLLRVFAANVYDVVIVRMTCKWYAAVLNDMGKRLPGSRSKGRTVLDVGVGTSAALLENTTAVLDGGFRFVGVDYDGQYIAKGRRLVANAGMENWVQLHCHSVYDEVRTITTRIHHIQHMDHVVLCLTRGIRCCQRCCARVRAPPTALQRCTSADRSRCCQVRAAPYR